MGIDADRYLPKGSFAVFDRGFNDYGWFSRLDRAGVFFVTRLKKNADVEFLIKRSGRKSAGICSDQQIRLKGIGAPLRLVQYTDPETGKKYCFLTNAHHQKAAEIAARYKERWQIEHFFKWVVSLLSVAE